MEKRTGPLGLFRDLDLNIALVTLTALIVVTVMGVVMRYFVNKPITWLEEVQLWFIVWIVFFGASAVARKTGHIAIDAFVGLFPRRLRMWTKAISNVTTILVIGFLGYYACRHVNLMFASGRATNILSIPYYLIYGAIPVSCLLIVINSGSILYRLATGKEQEAANV